MWKGILTTTAPFHASIFFSLGNGKGTSFWNARWAGEFTLTSQFPNFFTIARHKHLSVFNWVRRFAWTENLGFHSSRIQGDRLDELQRLRFLILNTALDQNLDTTVWRWNDNGGFQVRRAYHFLTFDGTNVCRTLLWKTKIPLRVNIFIWLAARNRVLTDDTLVKKGWHGPSICALCSTNSENLDHIYSLAVMQRWCGINYYKQLQLPEF